MSDIQAISTELSERVERSAPSVVRVHAGHRGGGSGLVWSERVVVTAAHNLTRAGEEGIEVSAGGERIPVTLLGVDPATDLAALQSEVDLVSLPPADPEALRLGQLVLGLGRSNDGLRASIGVLAALGDAFRLSGASVVDRYLETDLRVAPGFSGSALLSVAGELIGMNTAGLVRGTALVLPVSTLARVVEALARYGRVPKSYLGVSVQPARLPAALSSELGQRTGLAVLGIEPGGPAEQAGVLLGDVLLGIGDSRLSRVFELQAALPGSAANAPLDLSILRAGEKRTLRAEPRIRP
jgi:S1-C subfamily serine protease